MKILLNLVPGLVLLVAALHTPGGAAALQRLRDPFERPAAAARAAPPAAEGQLAATPAADNAPAWKPELRAVMYDQVRPLVNVSGSILAIGESVQGYRVVKVRERSVTMSKGGTLITLTLDNREKSQ